MSSTVYTTTIQRQEDGAYFGCNYNQRHKLEPQVKPFFNWRSKSIVHSWLYFEHHFFTSLSKMSPTKPDFVKSDRFSVVPSTRTQCGSKIKGAGILFLVSTLQQLSQALFTLICLPLFAFLLKDCLLLDFCTFLLTSCKEFF